VSNFRWALLASVCVAITAPARGWAAPAHKDWVDDPYAPHDTRGSTVRLGTASGFLYGERVNAIAVGATLAVGQRFGRFTLESELAVLALEAPGGVDLHLGDAERLGVIARYDVLRIGSTYVGANSMLALYVEAGAAVAWNHWYKPGDREPDRVVPDDTKRPEGQLGFGVALDHRLQQPVGFPRRIGWFLGWRLALAPHASDTATVCRGTTCRAAEPMAEPRFTDRSMLFQSSLAATW
jgi:hypothetical protein